MRGAALPPSSSLFRLLHVIRSLSSTTPCPHLPKNLQPSTMSHMHSHTHTHTHMSKYVVFFTLSSSKMCVTPHNNNNNKKWATHINLLTSPHKGYIRPKCQALQKACLHPTMNTHESKPSNHEHARIKPSTANIRRDCKTLHPIRTTSSNNSSPDAADHPPPHIPVQGNGLGPYEPVHPALWKVDAFGLGCPCPVIHGGVRPCEVRVPHRPIVTWNELCKLLDHDIIRLVDCEPQPSADSFHYLMPAPTHT